MVDREAEINEAFTKKNKLTAYLKALSDERAQLLSGVLGDPVEITVRLAQIDAELAVGKEVSQATEGRYEEIRRRNEKAQTKNYVFGIAQRG